MPLPGRIIASGNYLSGHKRSASGGPVFAETRSALYDADERPMMVNYVYGLGGRDVTVDTFGEIYSELFKMIETGKTGEVYRHIGVRDLEEQKS